MTELQAKLQDVLASVSSAYQALEGVATDFDMPVQIAIEANQASSVLAQMKLDLSLRWSIELTEEPE